MTSNEAVAARITELCRSRNLTFNSLANESGMPPSTLYSIICGKSSAPQITSINTLCDGMGISLRDFFQSSLFEGLEPEIY